MTLNLLTAFLLGLFSSVHCLGMCGGILGAFTFSLPKVVQSHPTHRLLYSLSFNLGRLFSYGVAGAIVGGLGNSIFIQISSQQGHFFLATISSVMLFTMGLYLCGLFPYFAVIERLGVPFWQKLAPLRQKFFKISHPLMAFLSGVVWGWLPCGLVYSTLLWLSTHANAYNGAVYMLSFGLGTLPVVLSTALFVNPPSSSLVNHRFKAIVGGVLMLMSILNFSLQISWPSHH